MDKKDKNLIYFLAGFIKALNISRDIYFRGNYKLYKCEGLTNDELLYFYSFYKNHNFNKIICTKYFLSTILSKEIVEHFWNEFNGDYKVIFVINYTYKKDYIPYCFNISKYSMYPLEQEVLFNAFSFFKIRDFQIDEVNKKAVISLDSIGLALN